MEKLSKKELGPEELDAAIEHLLEKEGELFARHVELYGEPNDELDKREWEVVQESNAGLDRKQAKERLEEFIDFLEKEIAKNSH